MEPIINFFDLTKNEQRGILSLLILMMLLLGCRLWMIQDQKEHHQLAIQANRESILNELEANDFKLVEGPNENVQNSTSSNLHTFDPNLVDESELRDLGFKEYQIKNIINFRKAGGKFHKPNDLRKIYSIKEKDLEKFYPYVSIFPVQPKSPGTVGFPATSISSSKVELNSADSVQLKSLKGIGGYFARKIIERREKLGGFVSIDQLVEVWRLDPSVVQENKGRLTVDLSLVRRIPINTATIEQLGRHPYIGYKLAKALVNYRDQHGRFTAIKEISNSVLITDSLCSKIAPYLSVDDQR